MREFSIFNTDTEYQTTIVRKDGQRFFYEVVPEELENVLEEILIFSNGLKTDQEIASELASEYIVETAPIEKQLELIDLFPEWKAGMSVEVDKRIQHEGILYRVIQAHTTQVDWLPETVPALFERLSPVEEVDKPQQWKQPTGTHDAYMTGDRMIYTDEKTYESLIDNNVWSPVDYPTGWEEVTE